MGIQRIEEFTSTVRKTRGINNLKKVVDAELDYLRNSYGALSSFRSAVSDYRSSIKNNPDLAQSKRILIDTYMILDKSESAQVKKQHKEQLNRDHSALRAIYSVDGFFMKAEQLLESDSYGEIILGLAALTGRRVAEIGCTAKFKAIDENTVMFSGQMKTKGRGEIGPYPIPVFGPTNLIIKALARLRAMKPRFVGADRETAKYFHNTASKLLSTYTKRHFSTCLEDPKPKDLRSVYAEIDYCLNGSQTESRNKHMSRILGHGEEDIQTADSYIDFYIADPDYQ